MELIKNIKQTVLKNRLKDFIILGLFLVIGILILSWKQYISGDSIGFVIAVFSIVSVPILAIYLAQSRTMLTTREALIERAKNLYEDIHGEGSFDISPENIISMRLDGNPAIENKSLCLIFCENNGFLEVIDSDLKERERELVNRKIKISRSPQDILRETKDVISEELFKI